MTVLQGEPVVCKASLYLRLKAKHRFRARFILERQTNFINTSLKVFNFQFSLKVSPYYAIALNISFYSPTKDPVKSDDRAAGERRFVKPPISPFFSMLLTDRTLIGGLSSIRPQAKEAHDDV